MDEPTVATLRALADLRHRDPEHVRVRVTERLVGVPPDGPVRAAGTWVLGLAAHELGRPAEAVTLLRSALRLAVRANDPVTTAASRASLAMSLLATGNASGAMRELQRARAGAPAGALLLVEPLWGVLLQRTGRLDEALDVFDRIVPILRRDDDPAGLARTLLNRGTLLAYQGRFERAVADLAESERLASERELWLLAAMAAHNLGFTEGRRIAIPAGLAGFERARAAYEVVGNPPRQVAVLAADHCELLIHAGLARDARLAAERALTILEDAGTIDITHETEIRLLLAQALLLEGDPGRANVEASRAADGFRKTRRRAWAALADYVAVRAQIADTEDEEHPSPELLPRARAITRALASNGWPTEAAHARVLVGRSALALGKHRLARRELKVAAAHRLRGAGGRTVDIRAAGWHAAAMLKLSDGDRAGAKRALRRGLALVEEHRATLTTAELRAGVAVHGQEIARLGLRLALADRRPLEVLRWAERWRAGALRLQPVVRPADPELAAAIAELHIAHTELHAAPSDIADERQRRVARLESEIRTRTLRAGHAAPVAPSGLDVIEMRRALGAAVLVEYVALEGALVAVVVTADTARLVTLGSVEDVRTEVSYLLTELRRAMFRRLPGIAVARNMPSGRPATAARLQAMVVDPLELDPEAELVIVPTGTLHDIPWFALPALYGRRVIVAPSADLWSRRRRTHTAAQAGRVLLAAGPGVPAARAEVEALAEDYSGATVLLDSSATVRRVLDALEGSDLVHLAAHGQFRADSPLFSSLRLFDGDLTMYELDHVGSAPATVVLPCCDAGRTEVLTGDELLGTTTAMLARGVGSVIAPVLPVPDPTTAPLMLAMHARLRRGEPPSAALAGAARDHADDKEVRTVASAFVCMGAGESE